MKIKSKQMDISITINDFLEKHKTTPFISDLMFITGISEKDIFRKLILPNDGYTSKHSFYKCFTYLGLIRNVYIINADSTIKLFELNDEDIIDTFSVCCYQRIHRFINFKKLPDEIIKVTFTFKIYKKEFDYSKKEVMYYIYEKSDFDQQTSQIIKNAKTKN